MKQIIGKKYRKEGRDRERLFTVIQCDQCNDITYQRRSNRVAEALEKPCRYCRSNAKQQQLEADREAHRHQSECDKALIASYRSAHKLHLLNKPDSRVTHGLCTGETKRTYKIWVKMMDRCNNPKNTSYELYGGKGVVVCQRWHNPQNFVDDMGLVPPGYSIERNDAHGNYEPLNCRWIPKTDQSANRRICYSNRHIPDVEAFKKQKAKLLNEGKLDVETIPYGDKNGLGWWREFGLYNNPYIYGPMPWKKTGIKHRRAEAIERGWYVPKKKN